MRQLVHTRPDATLAEACEQLQAQRDLRVSVPTIHTQRQPLGSLGLLVLYASAGMVNVAPGTPRKVPAKSQWRSPHV
jgi:hypothetical protein